ncbi:MMPL family transporter [Candidatus Acetothermia bacterium]|nr:MMPL family transporter [Candidatus Acetothermia bacterium]
MEFFLGLFQRVTTRFPGVTLIALGVVSVTLGYFISTLRVANDPQEFLPNDPLAQASKQIEAQFGASSFAQTVYVRFVPKPGQKIESAQAVLEMESVLRMLRAVPGIQSATGIPDYVKALRRELHGGQLAYAQLPSKGRNDDLGYSLDDLARLTLERMSLAKRFVSAQGTAIVTATVERGANLIEVSRDVDEKLTPLRQAAQATDFSAFSYGSILDLFNRTTQRDARLFLPLVAALALLAIAWVFRYTDVRSLSIMGLLWLGISAISFSTNLILTSGLGLAIVLLVIWSFRRLSNLYLPLGTVLLAGLWTFGLLGVLGLPFNFLMLAVIPLLLGVGIDYPMYLLYRYEEERQRGLAGTPAIAQALRKVGSALTLTTLTSIAGFSSLVGINSPPVQAFGMLSNLAVASSYLITLLFVPAMKQLLKEPARVAGSFGQNRLGQALSNYAGRMNRRAIAASVLLIVMSIGLYLYWSGHSLKTVAYDPRRLLPANEALVQLYDQINDEFHIYDEAQILLKGDVTKVEAMRSLVVDIPARLSASPYTQKLTSIAQYVDDLRSTNTTVEKMFESKISSQDLNSAYRWIFDYIFSRPELRSEAESLIQADPSGHYTALLMRVNTLRSPDQAGISEVAQDISRRLVDMVSDDRDRGSISTSTKPESFYQIYQKKLQHTELQMTVTGAPYLQSLSLSILQDSLYRSLVLSLVLCALIMMIALRSVRWGLISLMPVALTAWLVLGTIRLLGIELSVATAMVTAISIGLGVDYAIHWVERFREERDLRRATARTGEALFGDFITTLAAFVSLIFGQIIWNRDFGLLAAIAMTYAFLLTVFVFPALLSFVKPWLPAPKEG